MSDHFQHEPVDDHRRLVRAVGAGRDATGVGRYVDRDGLNPKEIAGVCGAKTRSTASGRFEGASPAS